MKVLFDTNIIIDVLARREETYEASFSAISLCDGLTVKSCITSNTVTDIAYILHRYGHTKQQVKAELAKLFSIIDILAVDSSDCTLALSSPVEDFEDAVLAECAKRNGADYIITRNSKDYLLSPVPSMSPWAFCELVGSQEEKA